MRRNIEIDALRGLMLVWMTLVHLPTSLTPWVNQPIGYIGASEGFIFLSALFTGRIYIRLLERNGPGAMAGKLFFRTFKLYAYHILLLLGVFIVAGHYAIGSRGGGLHNLLDFYFAAGPARAIRDSLLLIYRPPLLDIMPLYIIFLLISPFVILISTRLPWKVLFCASFALWFIAQFGFRKVAYTFLVNHFGLRVPLNEMGAFNLWAWQFVWMAGLWVGALWAKDAFPAMKWARRAWIPAAAAGLALLLLRYAQIDGLNLSRVEFLIDKWNLGPARLVNLLAIGTILIRFGSSLSSLAIRPLVQMGQASLRVFCAHFACCFIGIGMMGNDERVFGWRQALLIVATFAVLWGIARISARPELSLIEPSTTESVKATGPLISLSSPALGQPRLEPLNSGGPSSNGDSKSFPLYNSNNPAGIKSYPYGAQAAPGSWREYENAPNFSR